MKDEKTRYKHYMPDYCTLGAQTGPQTIIVRQVLGEREKQKALDIHVHVPERKPAIEQVVDVFVKNVEVNCVDVITDKVVVRGEFEIKAIYVACLPDNPVHAVEIKHFKWTQDIDIIGARRGMDAEANVVVEFVDYDVQEMTRAYKYKYHGNCDPCEKPMDSCEPDTDHCTDTKDTCDCATDDDCMYPPHHPMPPFKPPTMHPCPPEHPCKPNLPPFQPPMNPCPPPCPPPKPPRPPKPPCPPCPPICCEDICCRDFDVSIVLKITAKVLADREVQMNARPNMTSGASMTLPSKPKG